jgi:hypothetical protein
LIAMPSLYRRLLGPAFDTLPAALRDFHDVETEWHGQAEFRITRGKGRLRGLLADLGGLPRAGEAVPVRLTIRAEGDGERWERDFGGKRLVSVQRAWRGLLVESFGAVTLGFRLVVEPLALKLMPARFWALGVPWFRRLAPHGEGVEVGQDDGCAIVATAHAPCLGMLVRYEGLVRRV